MRDWVGYTGHSLILGRGRMIGRVIFEPAILDGLLASARAQYREYETTFPEAAFIAALLAPMAMRELAGENRQATAFSSVGEVMALFDALDINEVAVNIYNGQVASAYEPDAEAIARGFSQGALLLLPRDAARLHGAEVMATLPGVVAFLLSQAHEERKSFAEYLRRGTPPCLSHKATLTMAALRPTLKTWEREARLEAQYREERL